MLEPLNLAVASHVHDAINCLRKAETALRRDIQPHREAVQRELVAAEVCLSRVLSLVGGN